MWTPKPPIRRLIGDCAGVDHMSYQTPITQEKAQEMVDLLLAALGFKVQVKVRFTGYRTKSRYGTLNRRPAWYDMTIYKIGENEGTILHELAHLKGCRHDRTFKDFQKQLIDLWYGKGSKQEIKAAAGLAPVANHLATKSGSMSIYAEGEVI